MIKTGRAGLPELFAELRRRTNLDSGVPKRIEYDTGYAGMAQILLGTRVTVSRAYEDLLRGWLKENPATASLSGLAGEAPVQVDAFAKAGRHKCQAQLDAEEAVKNVISDPTENHMEVMGKLRGLLTLVTEQGEEIKNLRKAIKKDRQRQRRYR
jgi:hypothetical protein